MLLCKNYQHQKEETHQKTMAISFFNLSPLFCNKKQILISQKSIKTDLR